MNILLINPPANHTIASIMPGKLENGLDALPPLGLLYIAAYLQKHTTHTIRVLDGALIAGGMDELKTEIIRYNPDVVGMTAMTFTLLDVIATAQAIKSISSFIKIIIGGPHATIYPTESLSINTIDFVVQGEGEAVIVPLLEHLNDMAALSKIKGLAFRNGSSIINTGQSEFIHNLDALPFPARELTPYNRYFSVVSSHRPVTTMITSRGCPCQCTFCERPQLGKLFRARCAQSVVDELAECQKIGIKEIFVYDDTFAINRARVLDICRLYHSKKLSIRWDIRTRVNTVDDEILGALKRANCKRIHFGVEAGTQKILDVLKKGITVDQIKTAFALARKHHLQTTAYFMFGSPTETESDINTTIELMKEIKPDFAQFAITTPFPGTQLYKAAREQGIITTDVWQKFAQNPTPSFIPPLWDRELSRDQLLGLLKKAYRSFYLRPGFIINQIVQIRSLNDLMQKIKAGLRVVGL